MSDNRHVFGMLLPASYPCIDDFIDAINDAPELAIKLQSTDQQWQDANRGFWAKSTNEIMSGSCLALDGFFQRSNKPTKSEVANQLSYYPGHYESYDASCQSAVYRGLQFAYFGVLSPGSTH